MMHDEGLDRAVRAMMIQPARRRVAELIGRAVERGEIRRDHPALPYVDTLFMAPVMSQPLLRLPYDDEFLAGFHEHVVLAVLDLSES